MKMIIRL